MSAVKALGSIGMGLWLASCRPATEPLQLPAGDLGTRLWREARGQLAELRERHGAAEPYTMKMALELTEPRSGKRLRARGAVAVSPPAALRMILLGPGGTTALDMWVCHDRFRFVIPAVDLVRRGDATTPPEQLHGLPVEFLRWWLLRPMAGALLYFESRADGRRYVLRHRSDEIIDLLVSEGGGMSSRRLSGGDEERVDTDGPGCRDVRYRQRSTGLDIHVSCEEIDRQTPPPRRAFTDPDDPEHGCALGTGAIK